METSESPPAYSRDDSGENVDTISDILDTNTRHKQSDTHFNFNACHELNTSNFPFPGISRVQKTRSAKDYLRQLGTIDLPVNLVIAQQSLTSTISALYAIMITVTCLVFVSTELITNKVPFNYFETRGFYTYLYSVSIIFMLYIFIYLLRVKKVERPHKKDLEEFLQRFVEATGVEVTEVERGGSEVNDVMRLSFLAPGTERREEEMAEDEMLVKLTTSENEKSHGSMMLRIGAIAFGLGTIVYTGLEFVHFFEMDPLCERFHILHSINPILHMTFTFMQMYYVFVHARLNIQRNKMIAKFGLMHMFATNCCVWIRTLVRESAREIMDYSAFSADDEHMLGESSEIAHNNLAHFTTKNQSSEELRCSSQDILGDTIVNCSVYLFPFIIEYSMIGGHIIYNMWRNVGTKPKFVMLGDQETSGDTIRHQKWDWSASSTGLFVGLSALATLIITLILYFSLVNQEDFQLTAVLMINISDTVINSLMITATLIGLFQVRNLKFVKSGNEHDGLLIIGAFGIFLYASYTIIAGSLCVHCLEPGSLVIVNGVIELIQVNLQLLFVADLKQKKITEQQKVLKPGRQVITFLIFCNLGLWITYNFEIQKVAATPDQLKFYGFLPWVVIQRITLPLCVFFRFHSTVVFAELWKDVYIIKEDENKMS